MKKKISILIFFLITISICSNVIVLGKESCIPEEVSVETMDVKMHMESSARILLLMHILLLPMMLKIKRFYMKRMLLEMYLWQVPLKY